MPPTSNAGIRHALRLLRHLLPTGQGWLSQAALKAGRAAHLVWSLAVITGNLILAMRQAKRDFFITEAEGPALRQWAADLGVVPLEGETDAALRSRLLNEMFRERVTKKGIIDLVSERTGLEVTLREPWRRTMVLDGSLTLGDDAALSDAYYTGGNLEIITSDDHPNLRFSVEESIAAGVKPHYIRQLGSVPLWARPGEPEALVDRAPRALRQVQSLTTREEILNGTYGDELGSDYPLGGYSFGDSIFTKSYVSPSPYTWSQATQWSDSEPYTAGAVVRRGYMHFEALQDTTGVTPETGLPWKQVGLSGELGYPGEAWITPMAWHETGQGTWLEWQMREYLDQPRAYLAQRTKPSSTYAELTNSFADESGFVSTRDMLNRVAYTELYPIPETPTGFVMGTYGVDPDYTPVYDVLVPVGQLNQALLDAHPIGTRFALEAGVHRLTEPVILKESQQLLGYPGAVINGSKLLTGWVKNGSNWYVTGQTQRLPYNADQPGGVPLCWPDSPFCNRTEDVFFDDQPLQQVGSIAELTTGTFYFDYTNSRIYLSENPNGHKVETSVATKAIGSSGPNVVIRNLVVEKFGNKSTTGALANEWGHENWLIKNCDIRFNHGVGIFVGHGARIIGNKIHHQGQLGLAGHGENTLVEGNEVAYNNIYGYDANNEAGASKWVATTGLTVRNNWTHHNYGAGFWTDINNKNVTYENNLVEDNQYQGLFHEISQAAIIRNNTVRRNGISHPLGWDVMGAGILISNSVNVDCYNNTVEDNLTGIMLLDDLRGDWEVINVNVHDNTIRMPWGWSGLVRTYDSPDKSLFYAQNNRFQNNTWIVPTSKGKYWDWDGGKTWQQWQAIPNDATGTRTMFPPGPGFYTENVPSDGLMGAWEFTDGSGTTVSDSGPFGKRGIITDPAPVWVTEGLEFDGTKNPVPLHDTSGMRFNSAYHVIAVYQADVAASMAAVSQQGEWYLRSDGTGNPTLGLFADGSYHEKSLTESHVGDWVCVDAFRNVNTMGLRVNNNNSTMQTLSGLSNGASWYGNWQCSFGGSDSATDKFDGKLAFVAVYDRKLNDVEMAAMYTELKRILPLRGISLPETPVVQAPTGLTVLGGSATEINLGWDEYVLPGFKQYLVFRDGVQIATITNKATPAFSDPGRDPETTYTYTLKVENTGGQVSAASASVATRAIDSLMPFDGANIPSDGLMGAWAFDDGSGTTVGVYGPFNKPGIMSAPEPTWVIEGLEFNGANGTVALTDTSGMREATNFHVVVVYKADVEGPMAAVSQNGEWYIKTDATGKPAFGLFAENIYHEKPLLDTQVGNWVCVDAYRNGSTMGVRLNANNATKQIKSGLVGGASWFGNWQFTFGGSETPAEKLDGKIAFVAFYDHKLSDAEMAVLYTELKRVLPLRGVPLPDMPAIQPPSGLAVLGGSATQINLSWEQYVLPGFKNYLLYRDGVLIATIADVTTTSYSDPGRDPETEYTYTLKVENTDNQVSDDSAPVSVTPVDSLMPFEVANIPATGLMGAWAFDDRSGTTVDVDGPFNKPGLMSDPAPTWVIEGLEFDGTKNPVALGDTSGMRELTAYHVITVYQADVAAKMAIASQQGEWYVMNDETGHPSLSVIAGGTAYAKPLTDVQVGNWVCVDAYRDSTTMGIRLNGNNGTAQTLSGLVNEGSWYGNWQCTFGGSESAAEKLDGKIAFVAIYDRKLSDVELAAVYAELRRVLPLRGIPLPELPAVQPPTGLTATAISPTRIDLDWDQHGSADFKQYIVFRDGVQIATITNRATTTYSDTERTPETEYTYTLKVENTDLQQSGASVSVSATTMTTAFMVGNIPATGLLAAWSFGEGSGTTTDDLGPDDKVAVFSTPAPTWATEGLAFSGSEYLTVNPAGQLSFRSAYHIIAVFQADVANKSVAVAQGDIYLGVSAAGHPNIMAVAEGTSKSLAFSENVVGSWVCVDAWRSGADFGIRLNNDNAKKATDTLASGAASWYGNNTFTIGRSEGNDLFEGKVAMVLVYDHALTDAEVDQVYAECRRVAEVRSITLPVPGSPPEVGPLSDPGVDPDYTPVYDVLVPVGQLDQALVDANPEGTRFALEAGVHRLTSPVSLKTNQELLGYPGAIINGSKVLTGWVQDGSNWYVTGQTQRLPETTAFYQICSASNPLCNKAEDVFFDDERLRQVATLAELATGKFFFDYTNSRIYLADDPTGHKVETTVAPQAINGSGSGCVVRNIIVEKFGNRAQIGAISDGKQPGWLFLNCEARFNHGGGIQISGSNAVVRNSKINYNGQIGVVTYYDGVNKPSNLLVEGCEIAYNNTEGYNAGWEAGGTKFSLSTGLNVRNNEVHHNSGPGIWCDIDVDGATIANNLCHHNADKGIGYEISYNAVIENNVVWENGYGYDVWVWGSGILVQNSSGVTVRNNLVAWNRDGIGVIQQRRDQWTEVTDVYVHDNVIASGQTLLGWVSDLDDKTMFYPANNNRGANNKYYDAGGASWEWNGWKPTLSDINNTPGEEDGTMLPLSAFGVTAAGVPTVNLPPAKPTGLSAAPTGEDILVTWDTHPEANFKHYLLYRNGVLTATITNKATTSYLDSTVTLGTSYSYTLQVENLAGDVSPPSNPAIKPSAGFDVNMVPSGSGLLALWTMDDGEGTTVTDKSSYGRHGTFGASGPEWTAEGLKFNGIDQIVNIADQSVIAGRNMLHVFALVKVTGAGARMAIGKTAEFRVGLSDGHTQGMSRAGSEDHVATLPANRTDQWVVVEVLRDWSTYAVRENFEENRMIIGPTMYWNSNGSSVTTGPITIGAYDGLGHFEGTIALIAVYNYPLSGTAIQQFKTELERVMPNRGILLPWLAPPAAPPAAPTGLTATPASYQAIDLSWDESPSMDFKRYVIFRDGVQIATVTKQTTTTYTEIGLPPDTTYAYTMKVENNDNQVSDLSDTATATTDAFTGLTPFNVNNVPHGATLLALWPMEDNSGTKVTDLSAYSRHGSFAASGPTWTTEGLEFNGVDQLVNVAKQAGIAARNMYHVFALVKVKASGNRVALGKFEEFRVGTVDGLTEGMSRAGLEDHATTLTEDNTGEWVLVEVMRDWGTYGVRQNFDDSTAFSGPTMFDNSGPSSTTNGPITIGGYGGGSRFKGTIAMIAVYDYPLEASAITQFSAELSRVMHDRGITLPWLALPAPTGLTATTVSYQAIDLDWDESLLADFKNYLVYRDGELIATITDKATTTYSDTGLTASTGYTYALRVENNDGLQSHQITDTATTNESPFFDVNNVPNGAKLLALWTMEDGSGTTVTDKSSHGRHGTFAASGPVWTAEGLQFNGVDQLVNIADQTVIAGRNMYHVFALVKVTNATGARMAIGKTSEFRVGAFDGKTQGMSRSGGENNVATLTPTITDTWTLVEVTRDWGTYGVRQNFDAATAFSGSTQFGNSNGSNVTTGAITLGGYNGGSFFQGTIALIAIYDYPLSEANRNLFKAELNRAMPYRGITLPW